MGKAVKAEMTKETIQKIGRIAKDREVILDADAIDKFARYLELLQEWNERMNLTAITSEDDVITRHFLDSLAPLFAIKDRRTPLYDKGASLIDIGTGAGFPGIPLAIVLPELKITLADSLHKRIGFLETVKSELQLDAVTIVEGRAEELARSDSLRECFDIAVARAVAELSTLSEYALPFVRVGGTFMAYKGSKAPEEAANAESALALLGGSASELIPYTLSDCDDALYLVCVKKKAATPEKYPRRTGIPSKRPL